MRFTIFILFATLWGALALPESKKGFSNKKRSVQSGDVECSTNADCIQRGLPLLKPKRNLRKRDSYSVLFPSNGTVVSWTVPRTGTYKITTQGGSGGTFSNYYQYQHYSGYPGKPAKVQANFWLVQGQPYYVVAGGMGNQGSGGGMSIVYQYIDSSKYYAVLQVAGGSGGAGSNTADTGGNGYDVPLQLDGGSPATSGGSVGSGQAGGAGGNNGQGGSAGQGSSGGAAGAGVFSSGGSQPSGNPQGGLSFPTWAGGKNYLGTYGSAVGGFGGGAGGSYAGGGGGGGYSGGGGGYANSGYMSQGRGGGAGSCGLQTFWNGYSSTGVSAVNVDSGSDGFVQIDFVSTNTP